MKSVRPPVARETLPFTSASTAIRLTWPSKFSVPLCTLSLKDMSLPLSVGVPTFAISDSGTPLTVAVASKSNGPWKDPTDASASRFSAFSVWPVLGLV